MNAPAQKPWIFKLSVLFLFVLAKIFDLNNKPSIFNSQKTDLLEQLRMMKGSLMIFILRRLYLKLWNMEHQLIQKMLPQH